MKHHNKQKEKTTLLFLSNDCGKSMVDKINNPNKSLKMDWRYSPAT
jgi:hypothetical protein